MNSIKEVKYAIAETCRTTNGIVAIIFLSSLVALILLNDTIGLGCYLFRKDEELKEKPVNKAKSKKRVKKVKLVYLTKGGTKF